MKTKALLVSQELDLLIVEYYNCETEQGKKIVKVLIEAKRRELERAYLKEKDTRQSA